MKTLKLLIEESKKYLSENPDIFKRSYSKKMGGTQELHIEGVGVFNYDDRLYYKGRGAKYNSASMHDNLGVINIRYNEFEARAKSYAKMLFEHEKNKSYYRKEERKRIKEERNRINEAVSLIGKENVKEGISIVLKYKAKTYYFIKNVMFYKGYMSDNVHVEVVDDKRRSEFVWEDWYRHPFAAELGMTPNNKNLFIC